MSWFYVRSWVLYCVFSDSRFLSLERKVSAMATSIDDLKADFEEYKKVVDDGLDSLDAMVADLKSQLEALPNDTAKQEALASEILEATKSLRGRLKPADEPSGGV